MKRIALLILAAGTTLAASAQSLTLSGTSYTQNFNGLGGGLPTGWHVFNFATSSALGIIQDTSSKLFLTPSSNTAWKSTAGGYKNFASANNTASFSPLSTDTAGQNNAADRALGVRQVSGTSASFPGTDSGASFALLLANTAGLTNFSMSFKLQSLDSSSQRVTKWKVQYGMGAIPTSFSSATATGTLTTGGFTYANNSVSVSFGTGLNNIAGPVWIRIVTDSATSGANNRASSAIDDVTLNWTGTAAGSPRPNIISMTPANNATGVAPASNLTLIFDKKVTKGTGNIYIKNRKTQTTNTIAASSASITVTGGYIVSISGVGLASNTTYHVTFDSTAFDTAGYHSYGIYDSTAWKFSTVSTGIGKFSTASLPVTVVNPAAHGMFAISCAIQQSATLTARVYDMNGRELLVRSYNAVKGENRFQIPAALPAGTYMIRVDDGKSVGSVKAIVE